MKRTILLTLFAAAAVTAAGSEVSVPVPPTLLTPPAEPVSPHQPVYGPILLVLPAHRLAMLEAGVPLPVDSAEVKSVALLLSQATARYVEDAPAIADLTARTCLGLRAAKVTASPRALLEAALAAKRPSTAPAGVPRSFEAFAAQYLNRKLHRPQSDTSAVPPRPVPSPAPSAVPPPRARP